MARVNRRTVPAVTSALLVIVLAACGGGRSYDNPPEVPVGTGSTTLPPTTRPSTTVFVPSTAPTTLAPPTTSPPQTAPPTAPPTNPPPQTPLPTQATVPTSPVPTTGQRYTVVQGDTLFGISRRLGVSLTALLAANGLTQNSLIVAGQQLNIPQGGSAQPTNPPPQTPPPTQAPAPTSPVPTTGQRYTVVQGDTLFGISRKLDVSLSDLLAANGLSQSSVIVAGQQLNIPQGGSVPATNATTQPAPGTTAPPQPTAPPAPTSPSSATTTFPAPPNGVAPQETSASCQAPDSTEADGTPIVFSPGNVLDRNPATAWRCEAPATGERLSFTFAAPTHLTSVGLIGGYVKVDPLTGVDRFTQNHRVRQVRWTFSDGTTVIQDLADSRDMQTITVDVTTTSATMEILATYPPQGPAPREMVPVAEVQFVGGG